LRFVELYLGSGFLGFGVGYRFDSVGV